MDRRDMVSATSSDGNSQILGTTRAHFLAFVASLEEVRDDGVGPMSGPVALTVADHALLLPVPAELGAHADRVYENGLTAITFEHGTTVQCMSGDPPRIMGAVTAPGRDGIYKVPALGTLLLCTLGQNRAADRWLARVDGFLNDDESFIVHVSSPSPAHRALVLAGVRRLVFA